MDSLNRLTCFCVVTVVLTAGLAGCGQTDPPPFRLDMTKIAASQISDDHQQAVADTLTAMFGTPDEPFAMEETGLDLRKLKMAAGPVWSDTEGGKHGLYRLHCAHCHGISGDGQGPTAMILNPYPRDYRPGVFKFKSTYTSAEPTDDDLRAILDNGIPGTAMPSFALLPPDEVDALVEYVKYLSMRGQMESALVNFIAQEVDPEDEFNPAKDAELREIVVDELLTEVVALWEEAPEQVIVPGDEPIPPADRTTEQLAASIAAGRELFYGTRANCIQCHGPTALGDGQQTDFDNWTKAHIEFINNTKAMVADIERLKNELSEAAGDEAEEIRTELQQTQANYRDRLAIEETFLPLRNAIPRNLREGQYRGGQRPLDFYWRIAAGIPGTPMPATGPASPGAQGTLTEEEIWQIVDYVQSLPFEQASRPGQRPMNVEVVN
jgi:mono/diheme cytochrome c family protein